MAGYRFDDVEVDPAGYRVHKAGRMVHVEPKAFELLLFLVRHPRELLTKAEIQDAVWPDAFVSENALTRLVAQVRRELGDDAREARYIETVPTRGYRFLPEVEAVDEGDGATSARARSRARRPALRGASVAVAVVVTGAALVVAVRRPDVQPEAMGPLPVQRTLEAGFRGGADVSPDGSQLVYTSDASGTFQLVVRPVDGGPELEITTGPGAKIEPAWSPDGRWIAYRDFGAGGIWLVAPTGGPPRQVTEIGMQPAWFPDGCRLVFSHPARPSLGAWEWPASYTATLWTVDVGAGDVEPLTVGDPEIGGQGMPSVSPDGRVVYYATGRWGGGGALWRVPAGGGAPECLTPRPDLASDLSSPWRNQWLDPTPTPDGEALLAINVSASSRIVRLDLAGKRATRPVLSPAPDGISHLALSRSGRTLVFTVLRGRTSIEEVDLDAGGSRGGSARTVCEPATKRVYRPQYSPDGERIAIELWRSGAGRELVVVGRGGEDQISLGARPGEVVWIGPLTVVFGAPMAPVELDIATRRIRSLPAPPGAQALTTLAFPRPFALASDLRTMAFTARVRRGGRELYVGNLETGEATKLTSFGRFVDFPFLSRDGRWVGCQVSSDQEIANEVWRLPTAGGDAVRLPTAEGPSWGSTFSPDGRLAAYAAHRRGTWWLAIAGVDRPEQLLEVPPETAGYLRWPNWSPDGRHIAYERMHYDASLWTLEIR